MDEIQETMEGIEESVQAETPQTPQAETPQTPQTETPQAKSPKRKKKFGAGKIAACVLSGVLVLVLGIWLCIAFLRPQERTNVQEGYGSVSYPVVNGEKFDPSSFLSEIKARDEEGNDVSGKDGYDAVDIFGRLNWTFAQQKNWTSEMHGIVDTAAGPQDVATYKRFADGILISSDITTSSLVNVAREFCYVGDRVIWRESDQDKSKWNGMDTHFSEGAPKGNMNISGEDGFKKKNGLPATELSVYIFDGKTVMSAELVEAENIPLAVKENGLYSVTYHLAAKLDDTTGAAAYYGNQMVFTGGIDAPPKFDYITVTYTFTEDWLVTKCEVSEKYTASMKTITTTCSSTSTTVFTYNVDGLEEDVDDIFNSYYKQYAEREATGEEEKELTVMDCLVDGLGVVLTEAKTVSLDLDVDGTKVQGVVYLDLSKTDALNSFKLEELIARLKVGDVLSLQAEQGTAYLAYGGLKLSLSFDELLGLFPVATAEENAGEEGETDILAQLMAGTLTVNEEKTHADLHAELSLGNISIVLDFSFTLNGEEVIFENANAVLDLGGIPVTAKISFTDDAKAPTALTAAEKAEYAALTPYLETVRSIVEAGQNGTLHIGLDYANEELGLSLEGGIDLSLADSLRLQGSIEATYATYTKTLVLGAEDGVVYLSLDGIKVKAALEDAIDLITGFFAQPEGAAETQEESGIDVGALVETLLSGEFANLFTSSSTESEITLAIAGTELLQAIGVPFELGTVEISFTQDALAARLLGAEIAVSAGGTFEVEKNGYAEIVPYASAVLDLLNNDYLEASVSFTKEDIGIEGTLTAAPKGLLDGSFDANTITAKGNFTLRYKQTEKPLTVYYTENTLYLDLQGVKVKANVPDAIAFVEGILATEEPASLSEEETSLLETVFSLPFDELLTLGEENDTLHATLDGTRLLQVFGIEGFDLGTVQLDISKAGMLSLKAYGAEITITGKDGTFTPDVGTGYVDVLQYASGVYNLLKNDYLEANVSFTKDDISIEGTLTVALKGLLDGSFDANTIAAKGDFTLQYKSVEKPLTVYYAENTLYLGLQGLKLKASVPDAIALVKKYLPKEEVTLTAEETSLVETLLGLDFGKLLSLTEGEGVLHAVLDGNLLLTALGVDFTLGQVNLDVTKEGNISANAEALGLSLTVGAGSAFSAVSAEGYADAVKYASAVLTLLENDFIEAKLSLETGDIAVTGTLTVALKDLLSGNFDANTISARGDFTLTLFGAEKPLTVYYAENTLYLGLQGIQIKANAKEAVSFVQGFLAPEEALAEEEVSVLEKVLGLDLSTLLTLTDDGNTLHAALDGEKLLSALGVEFTLGQVNLSVTAEGGISAEANALGLSLTIGAGKAFSAPQGAFIDVLKYANTVASLVQAEGLTAEVSYEQDGVKAAGNIQIGYKPLTVKAELTLSYTSANETGISKTVNIIYQDGFVYLTLDGLHIKADTKAAIALLEAAMGNSSSEAPEPKEPSLAEKLCALDFGKLLTLKEGEGALEAAVDGNLILQALGVNFNLGTITLNIAEEGGITAAAKGVNVTISAGKSVTAETSGYTDFSPALLSLVSIINQKALTFTGSLHFEVGDTVAAFDVQKGVVDWKDGVRVYLDANFVVGDSYHDITLCITPDMVQFAYGTLGAKVSLAEADLNTLKDAFEALKTRIHDEIVLPATENTDKADAVMSALSTIAEGGSAVTDVLSSFDWSMLDKLIIKDSTLEGGLLALAFENFGIDLLGGEGTLGVKLGYKTEGILLDGELSAGAFEGQLPDMPEIGYFTTEDFVEVLDFAGAAVGLIARQNATVTATGSVTSKDEKYVPYKGVKYALEGGVTYYSGDGFPFHLVENGGVIIETTMYLHIHLNVIAQDPSDSSLYLDLYLLDPSYDGTLDFYVSASAYGREAGDKYDPITFHAPADEIMTLLSGVFALFGVDSDLLNNVLITRWLDGEQILQLNALGHSIKLLVGQLLGVDLNGIVDTANEAIKALADLLKGNKNEEEKAEEIPSVAAISLNEEQIRQGLVKLALTKEEDGTSVFSLAVDGKTIYGAGYEGGDLTVTFKKSTLTEEEGEKSILSGIVLENIYRKEETTCVTFTFDTATPVEFDRNDYPTVNFDFDGIDNLLLALAKSATHISSDEVISGEETEHAYTLNSNFYISGEATINAIVTDVKIRLIAISVNVDENGEVGVNARIEYDGKSLLTFIAINGDSQLDLTLKGGMLYMKRVQTSDCTSGSEKQIAPITLYRAMPLSTFTSDILGQMSFAFNLGKSITDLMKPSEGGSDPAPEEQKPDFGTTFYNYVTEYTFQEGDGETKGDTWKLTFNGSNLTGGVLGEINVAFSANKDGFIEKVELGTKIYGVVSISANLNWHNAGGVMQSGVTDLTLDVAAQLERDMAKVLSDPDWEAHPYYEGVYATVTYRIQNAEGGTDVLGTQNVVYNAAEGDNTYYSELKYPSLDQYLNVREGYRPTWVKSTQYTGAEIEAVYVPNTYDLVFESEQQFEGAENRDGAFVFTKEGYVYGEAFELPQGRTNGQYIDYWYYEYEGRAYRFTSISDEWGYYPEEGESVTFHAHWADISYDFTFLGESGTAKKESAAFGGSVTAPAAPEKRGYDFKGWALGETLYPADEPIAVNEDLLALLGAQSGGNVKVQLTASFTPKTFLVTFESEYLIEWEGFDFTEKEGKWTATVRYTFGETLTLPSELRTKADGKTFFLDGFTYEGGADFITELFCQVDGETTFTAKWTEVGADVRFRVQEEDTVIATRNYAVGTQELTNLPTVPARNGYTGKWDIPEGFTVEERAEGYDIYAVYTPVTYYFTAFSAKEVTGAGWTRHDPVEGNMNLFWQWTFSYVYGSDHITTVDFDGNEGATYALGDLGNGVKTVGFDFAGFWSQPQGHGVKITVIGETLVADVFGYNQGNAGGASAPLDGRNILYAYWADNTVGATLYSSFAFDGAEGTTSSGLSYLEIARNDADYAISFTPAAKGRTFLGWWYEDGSDWRKVESLQEFYDKETFTASHPSLYALWMDDFVIDLTTFNQKVESVAATIGLGGTVTGGKLTFSGLTAQQQAAGVTAEAALAVTSAITGRYIIFNASGDSDKLDGGNAFAITLGEAFLKDGMTSFNARTTFLGSGWGGATYGGVEVKLVLTQNEAEVATAAYIHTQTFAQYTVRYLGEDGNPLKAKGEDAVFLIRLDGSYRYEQNTSYPYTVVAQTRFADTFAEEMEVELPLRKGYDVTLPSDPITGNRDITVLVDAHTYEVLFVSDTEISGFTKQTEGDYAEQWTRRVFMKYGAKIAFYGFGGEIIGQQTTIDEPEGYETGEAKPIVIQVPAIEPHGGKPGNWIEPSITADGAAFTAVYELDTVNYHSGVPFDGAPNGEKSVQFDGEYTTETPQADGYIFLGWFVKDGEGWKKAASSLTPSTEETKTYDYYALWVEELTVSVTGTRTSRSTGIFNRQTFYTHTVVIAFRGGRLIGEPSAAVSISIQLTFTVNDSDNAQEAVFDSTEKTFTAFPSNNERTEQWSSKEGANKETHGKGHADGTVTYTFNGETIHTATFSGTHTY